MRALLLSALLLSGCSSNKETVIVYMEYDLETGVAEGYVESQGKITRVIMKPEQLELLSKKQ
jgi:hypothetical protein